MAVTQEKKWYPTISKSDLPLVDRHSVLSMTDFVQTMLRLFLLFKFMNIISVFECAVLASSKENDCQFSKTS